MRNERRYKRDFENRVSDDNMRDWFARRDWIATGEKFMPKTSASVELTKSIAFSLAPKESYDAARSNR